MCATKGIQHKVHVRTVCILFVAPDCTCALSGIITTLHYTFAEPT